MLGKHRQIEPDRGYLKFLYCNARSLNNKFDYLAAVAETYDPDVIGVSETWLQEHVNNAEISLKGYEMYRNDRCNGRLGDGVLLYIKTDIQSVEFWPTQFPEQVWCTIRDRFNREYLVGVTYRSPNDNIYGPHAASLLRDLMDEIHSRNIVLMGDFNYGNIDWNSLQPEIGASSDTVLFLECLENNYLTQHITESTRGNRTLDLLITRDPDIVRDVSVLDCLGGSDHCMVLWKVDFNRPMRKPTEMLDYTKGDYEAITKQLCSIDWKTYLTGDAENKWQVFKNLILQLQQAHIPVRRSKYTTKKQCGLTEKHWQLYIRKGVCTLSTEIAAILQSNHRIKKLNRNLIVPGRNLRRSWQIISNPTLKAFMHTSEAYLCQDPSHPPYSSQTDLVRLRLSRRVMHSILIFPLSSPVRPWTVLIHQH